MTRGDFRWRITIPDDGTRPARGIVPTLIQWDVPSTRPTGCPTRRCRSRSSPRRTPDPAPMRAALAALGLADVVPVTYDRETRLAAMLRTPRGIVTL